MRRNWSKFLIVPLLICLSSCAFGTRRPILSYTAVTPVRSPNNIVIKVVAFEDSRVNKKTIGEVRNAYGMKTADVITETNIVAWITNALKSELRNAGYTVKETTGENEIQGEILKVYCAALLNYKGEVMMKVSLKKGDEVLLDKMYSGEASKLNLACTAKGYGTTLEESLQKAMIQVVSDVDGSLK